MNASPSPLSSKLLTSYREFWLKPASPRPLAWFRIGLSAVLLIQALQVVGHLNELYGRDGIVDWSSAIAPRTGVPNLIACEQFLTSFGLPSSTVVPLLYAGYIVGLIGLLLGLQTRAAAVLTWLTHTALYMTGEMAMYGADSFAQIGLFYCLCFPVGHALSLDALKMPKKSRPGWPTQDARLGLRTLQVHIIVAYCASGLQKMLGQVNRMLKFCASAKHVAWFRPILITLATTGLRIGELIVLRWEDIDFDADLIRVMDERYSGKKNRMRSARGTTGKRSRSVPLHLDLKEVLAELPRHTDGTVFHGPKGGKLPAKTVLDIFKRNIRNKLKEEFPTNEGEVGFEHGTIHSFRHYFVSEAFRQGATEAEVMDWVGHRESSMVHHYRHLRPNDSQSRMRNINFLADDNVSSVD